MSDARVRPESPPSDSKWSQDDIDRQTEEFAAEVIAERIRQDERWGVQNIRDLQFGGNGRNEIGRSYRQLEQIMKYQCDRAAADNRRSMDLVFLEEVFEALAAVVNLADGPLENREALKIKAGEELIQTAAVCLKWAAMIERDEPRHG